MVFDVFLAIAVSLFFVFLGYRVGIYVENKNLREQGLASALDTVQNGLASMTIETLEIAPEIPAYGARFRVSGEIMSELPSPTEVWLVVRIECFTGGDSYELMVDDSQDPLMVLVRGRNSYHHFVQAPPYDKTAHLTFVVSVSIFYGKSSHPLECIMLASKERALTLTNIETE